MFSYGNALHYAACADAAVVWHLLQPSHRPESLRFAGDAADPPTAGTARERGSGMTTDTNKPYSVLITDDDPGSRETLRDIVETEGYRTILASSGEEALDIAREEPVHLAVFDVHMPRMTGVE